jgi:hypothetical protein
VIGAVQAVVNIALGALRSALSSTLPMAGICRKRCCSRPAHSTVLAASRRVGGI